METGFNSKAMLAAFSASQWTARRHDKKASKELAAKHSVRDKAIRVSKDLFPFDCDVYNAIGAAIGAGRTEFYEQTLPWLDNGARILTAANFLACGQAMRQKQSVFEAALQPFFDQYPFLKSRAEHELGGLFREEDFPELKALKQRYSWELKFYPIPDAADFRCEIHDDAVAAIKEQITLDTKTTIAKAMDEPYKRLFDGVAHMAARLSGSKSCPCRNCKGKVFTSDQFSDSLVNNLISICDTLPRLNLTADPYLENYIEQVKAGLTEFKPDIIRDSDALKKTLAERAAEIQRDLSGWMGNEAA